MRLATDERHAQLLAGARQLFSGHAFDELSTAEIARRLGVSKGLLFHYFGTKRGLYVATVRAAVDELIAVTEPDPSKPLPVQLWESMSAYLDWARANQSEQSQILMGGIGVDDEVATILARPRALTQHRVLTALGVDDATPELRMAIAGWIGFVEGVGQYWAPRHEIPREVPLMQIVACLQTSLRAAGVSETILASLD